MSAAGVSAGEKVGSRDLRVGDVVSLSKSTTSTPRGLFVVVRNSLTVQAYIAQNADIPLPLLPKGRD